MAARRLNLDKLLFGPQPGVAGLTSTDARSDARQQLIDAVQFGRRLIVIYNLILLGLLLTLTLIHWIPVISRIRKHVIVARNAEARTSKVASSSASSSTASSASDDIVQERKPLLTNRHRARPSRSWLLRQNYALRAWLMYQPQNLPFDKVLPSNLTTIRIMSFFLLNVFILLYGTILKGNTLFLFAERTGLLFVGNLPLLYLLAAKNCPIRPLTGLSYENLNMLHRRLGEWLCLLALAHLSTMFAVFLTLLAARGLTLWQFLLHPIIWLGLAAFVCYETLYLTSLASFRQRWYEVFLASHIVLQAAGLGFLFFHFLTTRIWVVLSVLIFVVDRVVYRLWLCRHTIDMDLTVLPDGDTLLLSANWMLPSSRSWRVKRDILNGWHPTAHVFISAPALSRSSALQSHPFTIASSAPDFAASRHAKLDLLIRARDGFTKELLHRAKTRARIPITIDGPYGSKHALTQLHVADLSIVVAGGSGIAVGFPLVWSLSHAASAEESAAPPQPDARLSGKRVVLIWITHDPSHAAHWLGKPRLDDLAARGVELIIPPATTVGGRSDVCSLLDGIMAGNTVGGDARMRRLGVVVSGPDGMNRQVRNWCAGMVRTGVDVVVEVEKFGW